MNKAAIKETPLADIMKRSVVTLSTEDTLDRAAEIFKNNAFHHIPVVNEYAKVVGMVSTTDLDRVSLGMSFFKNPNKEKYNDSIFRASRVQDIMSKEIVLLEEDQTLEEAYRIFWRGTIRCLPITRKGELVGIVSPLDIIETLLNEF